MTEKFKWINNYLFYKRIAILYIVKYTDKCRIYDSLVYNSGIAVLFPKLVSNYYGKVDDVIVKIERELYTFSKDFIHYYNTKYQIKE
jgi:hypothetical protein